MDGGGEGVEGGGYGGGNGGGGHEEEFEEETAVNVVVEVGGCVGEGDGIGEEEGAGGGDDVLEGCGELWGDCSRRGEGEGARGEGEVGEERDVKEEESMKRG